MTQVLFAALGGSAGTSDLYTVDPATGAMTSVGPIGFALTGLAQDPTTGLIYGITSRNSTLHPMSFISVDPTTGAGTLIAAESGGNTPWTDLAFDSSGQLYAQAQSAKLYSVDKSTGVGTVIGTGLGGNTFGGALAINSLDQTFGDPKNIGRPYSINKATGVYTALAFYAPPLAAASTPAASFDGSDVYWAVSLNTLFTVDLTTSAVANVVTLSLSGVDALAWCEIAVITDDFSVTLTPSSVSMDFDTGPATTHLSTEITLGSAQSITLSDSGAPAGIALSYSLNPITSGGPDSVITVTDTGAAAGTYTVTIHAVGTGATHPVVLTIVVRSGASVGPTLFNSEDLTSHPVSSTYTCVASSLAGDQIHFFWLACYAGPGEVSTPVSVTDSKGGVWSNASPYPAVGRADSTVVDPATPEQPMFINNFAIGSFVRIAGDPLIIADTVTVTWGSNSPLINAGIAQVFRGVELSAVSQRTGTYGSAPSSSASIRYDNPDPDIGGSLTAPTFVNPPLYRVDYAGLNRNPAPVRTCAYIGLAVCYDGLTFIPEQMGSVVTSALLAAGRTSLIALEMSLVFAPIIEPGTCQEPGGTFASLDMNSGVAVNYQFVKVHRSISGAIFDGAPSHKVAA